jgi:hypothetical protein
MTDPLEHLEGELESLRPAPISDELRAALDPLEGELRAMSPLPVSDRLRAGVEARLAGPTPAARRSTGRTAWMPAALAAAAAAVVVGLLIARSAIRDNGGNDAPFVKSPNDGKAPDPRPPGGPGTTPRFDPSAPPTLAAYRWAATGSPADFEALLDGHAGRLLPRSGGSPRAGPWGM